MCYISQCSMSALILPESMRTKKKINLKNGLYQHANCLLYYPIFNVAYAERSHFAISFRNHLLCFPKVRGLVYNIARNCSLFSSSNMVRNFFGRDDFFFKHSSPFSLNPFIVLRTVPSEHPTFFATSKARSPLPLASIIWHLPSPTKPIRNLH